MLILLITLILNQVNASELTFPKNGKYSFKEFATAIIVADNKNITAQIDDKTIPLTKEGETFSGKNTTDNVTTTIVVKIQNKKKLLAEVTQETLLPKKSDSIAYKFKDLDIDLVIENNLITALYTGLQQRKTATELKLNEDGTIASYNICSQTPYTLSVENSEIKNFSCNSCEYKILGINKSAINVSDNSFATFEPNIIQMYDVTEGIKKTIQTSDDARSIDITVNYYQNSDLLNGSTNFKVDDNSLVYKNLLKFIARKSL